MTCWWKHAESDCSCFADEHLWLACSLVANTMYFLCLLHNPSHPHFHQLNTLNVKKPFWWWHLSVLHYTGGYCSAYPNRSKWVEQNNRDTCLYNVIQFSNTKPQPPKWPSNLKTVQIKILNKNLHEDRIYCRTVVLDYSNFSWVYLINYQCTLKSIGVGSVETHCKAL